MSTYTSLSLPLAGHLAPASRPVLVTSGEPAGIGPDICLALAQRQVSRAVVVLGSRELLAQRAHQLGMAVQLVEYQGQVQASKVGQLYVLDMDLVQPVQPGQLNPANAMHVLTQLQTAADAALAGHCAAIVTAPVHKSVINEAGVAFSGHTEFFQQQAGVARVVMMLATGATDELPPLRVALVTTHLPLRDVADQITAQRLQQVIDILIHDLQQQFAISHPRILVCGLNPHAGEDGYLGREEIDLINPVLQQYQQQGIQISLALPADTLFTPHYLQQCDAVLAMYHDQGLPVLKARGFGQAVNITLGLPYIRTSVDHGTALDLAGTGRASSSSLYTALDVALDMLTAQQLQLSPP